jgi:hypothetical protein
MKRQIKGALAVCRCNDSKLEYKTSTVGFSGKIDTRPSMFEFFENLNNTRSDSPFLLVQS